MNKNFLIFITSSALTLLSMEIFHLAIPLTVLTLGYSAVQTGWCTFAFFLPTILVKLFISPLIESKNKKLLLLRSEVIRGLIIIMLIGVLFYIKNTDYLIWMIIPISFLFGIFSTLTEITEPAALKSLLKEDDTSSIISKYEIRTRGVQLLAPALCGILISFNLLTPYILSFFISCFSVFLLYRLNLSMEYSCSEESSGLFRKITDAAVWIKENKFFLRMVILTAINNFLHPILYLTIIYQLKLNNIGFDVTGYILSGLGIGGIIGSVISNSLSKRFDIFQLVIGVNILRIFVFLGFVIIPNVWGYFFFFILKAILGGIWNVCYNTYTIQRMPISYVARISGLSGLIIKIFTAIASLLAGYFIHFLGVIGVLYFLVMLTILMLVFTLNIRNYLDS
ncbi:MFS transporter [Bisgaard Taxon 10/6]|uniref:MFS transporter n=1 Tax=Exercitatus varius TaxID=67857 RepID=UPI00294B700C|nr:MFS transporter [Exercitatus varius]MDG2916483.1 MFS transporter [Exercitatus varius]MDG2951531.1 MFS transporter [Exercitatus varius]